MALHPADDTSQPATPATSRRRARLGGRGRGALIALCFAVVATGSGRPASAVMQAGDQVVIDARDALRKKDRNRLAALRAGALSAGIPLAMWPDYWELTNRIGEVQQPEVDEFSARWPGAYVEDRFRNDWLLELGKRRDWAHFAAEYPRFRMNDDREVACYALLIEQQSGRDVRQAALAAWWAQREADDGCALLAASLYAARQIGDAEIWRKVRLATEAGKPRAARQAAGVIGAGAASAVAELGDNPARYLARSGSTASRGAAELTTLALIRLAANDADGAAVQLGDRWEAVLPPDLAAWAWGAVAKQAALKLAPDAADQFQRAERASRSARGDDWSDDMLAWKVRAALRADNGRSRWQQVLQAIEAMSPAEQRDPAWLYWKARALGALAASSQDGEAMRGMANGLMSSIADQIGFYPALAAESLGRTPFLPAPPPASNAAERREAVNHPGLLRAIELIEIGLRSEGVREWNYSIRGMSDRELLAAAQFACERELWDRCINTSDRTRTEIDLAQRYPMPFRRDVVAQARETGIDPAYVYGLIRQESRFVLDARSSVGAAGLMQLMPATARWTAKKIGLDYTSELATDRTTNIRLGTSYLKLVLDDFGGSQALAAAAYNAGPGRPRRWREGPTLEPAIWAENVPFAETRDYVKKVLSNATYYAAQLGTPAPSLRLRLGRAIAPAAQANPLDRELP